VQAYRRRNFDEKALEETKPPLKRLYRKVGGGEAPEDIGHVMRGILEGVRRIPAKVLADYCSRILGEEVTVEEASMLIRKMEGTSSWARRASLLREKLGLGWEAGKAAYKKGYMRACGEAIEEAAKFLSYATPEGPKGPRAELVSGGNLCRVIGRPASKKCRIANYRGGKGVGDLLLDFGLTASNPADHSNVQFTPYDLRRGLYIPEPDEEAYALGLIYAFACISRYPKSPILEFNGRKRDEKLFEKIRSEMEGAYNITSKVFIAKRGSEEMRIGQRVLNVNGYEYPRMNYTSYGLCRHLRKDYGFPANLEEIREARVPRRIRGSDPATQRKFLKGILSKASLSKDGWLYYMNKSRRFLKDMKKMMVKLGVKPSMTIQKKGAGSYRLEVYQTPTRQLVEEELIDPPHP
ncbi:MAG: hypothetical protein GWO20_02440, partial [Candidatus Korarchaeota archaeon]|nr:hypothetical protein [Candidatus Korarchaeota archaeon]NIW12823.1 hypothetical protein [Candidatus Thorarchaeota archaeon]